jgi:hypothetical protein
MSKREEDHIEDLKETFANLRLARLKLNPNKCVFRVSKGKMLSYIINSEGIRANLDKTKGVMSMVEPSTKKEVQRLTGRVAMLNRFISKSVERSLPFFKVLKGGGNMQWGPEQSEAFQKLKSYLTIELLVTIPEPKAPLLLYVVAFDHVVSGALIQEEQKGPEVIQCPVYYISEALAGAKLNYSKLEKIAYAVLISRKLKHYFQAHEITIPTSQLLGDILRNKEASGKIGKWAIELS